MVAQPRGILWHAPPALAVGLLLASAGAEAQSAAGSEHPGRAAVPFPAFDIALSCQAEVDQAACVGVEAAERDALKVRWPQLPRSLQRECAAAGRRQKGSYSAARGCADKGQNPAPTESH